MIDICTLFIDYEVSFGDESTGIYLVKISGQVCIKRTSGSRKHVYTQVPTFHNSFGETDGIITCELRAHIP